jgi:hypothetical protein
MMSVINVQYTNGRQEPCTPVAIAIALERVWLGPAFLEESCLPVDVEEVDSYTGGVSLEVVLAIFLCRLVSSRGARHCTNQPVPVHKASLCHADGREWFRARLSAT